MKLSGGELEIIYFHNLNQQLNITEFGCHKIEYPRRIWPYVRNTYLLHVVKTGICHFCDFDVYPGQGYIISRNLLHEYSTEAGFYGYWFSLDGLQAERLLTSFQIPTKNHQLLCIKSFAYVEKLIEDAFERCKAGVPDDTAALSTFCSILPFLSIEQNVTYHDQPDIVKTGISFIKKNYQNVITMQQVASYVHVTEKHFCRKFKQVYGIPPQQYLLKLRMEKACELLSDTSLKIKEVAQSVGYDSQLSFSSAFRRHYSLSPSEFRKKKIFR